MTAGRDRTEGYRGYRIEYSTKQDKAAEQHQTIVESKMIIGNDISEERSGIALATKGLEEDGDSSDDDTNGGMA